MIKTSDIIYNISPRSVFDIAEVKYVPAINEPNVQNKIVGNMVDQSIPPLIDNMNGLLVNGTPPCTISPSLNLNQILRPPPLPDEYGMFPISSMRGVQQAPPMPITLIG